MFKVAIDFGDDALNEPRFFNSYSDLSSYLERVPNMLGFRANEKTQITITVIPSH